MPSRLGADAEQVNAQRRRDASFPLMWVYPFSDWLRKVLGNGVISVYLLRSAKLFREQMTGYGGRASQTYRVEHQGLIQEEESDISPALGRTFSKHITSALYPFHDIFNGCRLPRTRHILSAIGSEACRAGLINCHPIAKRFANHTQMIAISSWKGPRGVVVRLLASHLGKLGSIPGQIASRFAHVAIVPDDAAGRRVFSGSPVPPALAFRRYSILISIHHHRLSRPRYSCHWMIVPRYNAKQPAQKRL
ncbi:hypothetical protein PR048_025655 [Dryococelus australis]|uniref:Uncharacterized protein n=1 Tax=Dryococelus australis TaxID=614101 RepID=A0ABQ9GJ48_9NEOP|nr:hypothetical protein PR048_025655 [Dryococelus australis]